MPTFLHIHIQLLCIDLQSEGRILLHILQIILIYKAVIDTIKKTGHGLDICIPTFRQTLYGSFHLLCRILKQFFIDPLLYKKIILPEFLSFRGPLIQTIRMIPPILKKSHNISPFSIDYSIPVPLMHRRIL